MNLSLNPDIVQRITEQVRSGRFPTPEAVVEAAVAEFTDMAWDGSLDLDDITAIAEADAQIDRGEGMDLNILRAEISKRFVKP